MSKEELDREIDALAVQYSQKVKMPGFRQGKVPVDVVKKVYKQALKEEVIQQAVSKLAFARIEKDKIAVASEPYVEKMDHAEGEDSRPTSPSKRSRTSCFPTWRRCRSTFRLPTLKAKPSTKPSRSIKFWKPTKDPSRSRTVPSPKTTWCCCWSNPRTRAGKRKWPRQETYFMMNKEKEAEIFGLHDELLGKKSGEKFTIQRSYAADAAKKAWAGKNIEHQVEIKADL